jgi:hypothetical protein
MNTNQEPKTYATLKEETPFNHLFPDNDVPIISLSPVHLGNGAPLCYVIDATYLSDFQINQLAEMTYQKYHPECTSIEMAIEYVRRGVLVDCIHFSGMTTEDLGELMKYSY